MYTANMETLIVECWQYEKTSNDGIGVSVEFPKKNIRNEVWNGEKVDLWECHIPYGTFFELYSNGEWEQKYFNGLFVEDYNENIDTGFHQHDGIRIIRDLSALIAQGLFDDAENLVCKHGLNIMDENFCSSIATQISFKKQRMKILSKKPFEKCKQFHLLKEVKTFSDENCLLFCGYNSDLKQVELWEQSHGNEWHCTIFGHVGNSSNDETGGAWHELGSIGINFRNLAYPVEARAWTEAGLLAHAHRDEISAFYRVTMGCKALQIKKNL